MREIKFRAWHEGFKGSEPQMIYDINAGDCLTWKHHGQNISVIMQYTGLKDKNNTEIYEGDIVEFKSSYCGDKIIRTEVKYDEFLMSFKFDMGDDGHFRNDLTLSEMKLIGNIYNNPELLGKVYE
jgi:uncharacterized phage protein (TIGR01671 family)